MRKSRDMKCEKLLASTRIRVCLKNRTLSPIVILILLLIGTTRTDGQFSCGTVDSGMIALKGPSDCIDMDIYDLPVKTVRISIHVFQKNDGSENIPDDSIGNHWISSTLMYNINNKYANVPSMRLPTSSLYFSDSKIRCELVQILYWQDTNLWGKGNRNNGSHGQAMYDYIMNQDIPYKDNSVHILIPGNYIDSGNYPNGGRACGIGCNKWSMLQNAYLRYVENKPWEVANTIRHELGHNFNLYHAWGSGSNDDYCIDTEPHSNCWNGPTCSNNTMDYNASQSAFTHCQLSRMHEWLEANPDVVMSGMPEFSFEGEITWAGGSKDLVGLNLVPERQFSVEVNFEGVLSYTWTQYVNEGTFSPIGNGSIVNIDMGTETDLVSYEVSGRTKCREILGYYSFFNIPYRYTLYPNPANDYLILKIDQNMILEKAELGKNSQFELDPLYVDIYNQYNEKIKKIRFEYSDNSYLVDILDLLPGFYYMVIKNRSLNKTLKFQKL